MKVHIYYFENITETNLLLAVGTDNKVVQTFLHFECCYSYTKTWIFKQIIFFTVPKICSSNLCGFLHTYSTITYACLWKEVYLCI